MPTENIFLMKYITLSVRIVFSFDEKAYLDILLLFIIIFFSKQLIDILNFIEIFIFISYNMVLIKISVREEILWCLFLFLVDHAFLLSLSTRSGLSAN